MTKSLALFQKGDISIDPRLPNGGGYQVCDGLYDLNPLKFGLTDNVVTFAKDFGGYSEVYSGVDVTTTIRLPKGLRINGGTSTGRVITDQCIAVDAPVGQSDVVGDLPAILPRREPVSDAAEGVRDRPVAVGYSNELGIPNRSRTADHRGVHADESQVLRCSGGIFREAHPRSRSSDRGRNSRLP